MSSTAKMRALGCALVACAMGTSVASAQVEAYSQDFEGMDTLDTAAFSTDGWYGSVNVYDPFFAWLYGYFGFPPANDPAFLQVSLLVTGEGDAAQGAQQVAVFSDYTNGDHTNLSGNILESYFYREATITADNVGQTITFTFDAKGGDVGGFTEAFAFFKTLDPLNGWITLDWPTMDLTTIPTTWDTYSMSFPITEAHVGLVLQYGFFTICSDNEPSTNYYDNINLTGPPPPCPADFNGDGFLDNGDIQGFINAFLAGC